MMIFTFILVNIFIALLERAYSNVKDETAESQADEDAKGSLFNNIFKWCIYQCKKKPEKKLESNVIPPNLNIPFTNEPKPTMKAPYVFGRSRAEEINDER